MRPCINKSFGCQESEGAQFVQKSSSQDFEGTIWGSNAIHLNSIVFRFFVATKLKKMVCCSKSRVARLQNRKTFDNSSCVWQLRQSFRIWTDFLMAPIFFYEMASHVNISVKFRRPIFTFQSNVHATCHYLAAIKSWQLWEVWTWQLKDFDKRSRHRCFVFFFAVWKVNMSWKSSALIEWSFCFHQIFVAWFHATLLKLLQISWNWKTDDSLHKLEADFGIWREMARLKGFRSVNSKASYILAKYLNFGQTRGDLSFEFQRYWQHGIFHHKNVTVTQPPVSV